jgi:hypothetical protein
MMKRLAIMALLLQLPALAARAETKAGSCQLKEDEGFGKDVFRVQVGEAIRGTCGFYIQEFFKKKIINANIQIANASAKAMHCQYYAAFFDKAGTLIGCAGQGTFGGKGLAAGASTQLGSCLIPLPIGLHEAAVQYKIAFYESDQEIGKGASAARAPTAFRRKWTDATGSHSVEAELLDATGESVRLKKEDGQIVSVPLDKLSAADRRYVRYKELLHMPVPGAMGETDEGSCQLKEGDAFGKDAFTVQVGQKIKGTCKLYTMDFMGRKIINAGVAIVNTCDKAMHCQYYAAFFDKDGTLIGCAGQGTFGGKGLASGESTQLYCFIPLPAGVHEQAVQYKIAFYESDKEIGKAELEEGSRRHEKVSRAPQHDNPGPQDAQGPASQAAQERHPTGRQTRWFSIGPARKELGEVAKSRGHGLRSSQNHLAANYERILANSQPGSTVVLLFALDRADQNIPQEYQDLLPMPWAQIEAALKKGETVERAGKARGREIVLLAAPTEEKLQDLIHATTLLPP